MQDLAARLARGETAAFAELYDACGSKLHHFLVARLGSREAADEVLQETFLRLVRLRARFVSVGNPIAYAFTVARNEAIRARQRDSRERVVLSAVELFERTGHDDQESRETAQAVADALNQLADEQRDVIVLKIYSGLTFREIAEVIDIPQGTASTRYRAAIERLRGLLAQEWS